MLIKLSLNYIILLLLLAVFCSVRASETEPESKQVILTTVDGVKIHALEIGTGKDTMLIYCHRLLSSKESFHLARFGNAFLRKFDVMTLDFRGHNESSWISNCGGDEVLDLRAAIQYARNTHKKIVLLGSGMGGTVAIREAALFGNVDAVIAISPCGEPEKLKPWWWNLAAYISLTTDYGKIPIRILSRTRINGRYWTGSPVYLVDRVSPTPLLLIHGQDDRYLNPEQIQKLYDRAREPKRLLIMPRSEHAEGLLDGPAAELIIGWIEEVLSKQTSSDMERWKSPGKADSSLHPVNEIEICGDIVLPDEMIKKTIKAAIESASGYHEKFTRIKEELEYLHRVHGYIAFRVADMELSKDGKLSVKMEAGQIDHLNVNENRQVPSEQIRQALQIEEGQSYNSWEIEDAVKRLSGIPVFTNVESHLKQDKNGNTVEILVKERRPWSIGIATQFTDYDQFGGVRLSLNEFRSGAWKGNSQVLLGLQRHDLLYQAGVEKGWFQQEALNISLGLERYISSWDNLDYYFARQEAKEQGGSINATYKITDNASIHSGLSRKHFSALDWNQALPVDDNTINALSLRLENRGRFLYRGRSFFNWRSQIFLENGMFRNESIQDYTVFQINIYPELNLSPSHNLSFGLHLGHSFGDVPEQKLFSLGGDKTLPAYDDDALLGERFFLLRSKYDLRFGRWISETSRFNPLSLSFLLDIGDSRMKNKPPESTFPKLELGIEFQYATIIRLGFVKGLDKDAKAFLIYFGWHPHIVRSRLL